MSGPPPGERAAELDALLVPITAQLERANQAREVALPACRRTIRAASSSIRAVHRQNFATAEEYALESGQALQEAQVALREFPAVAQAGFLADAEREYAEARLTMALVQGSELPGPAVLGIAEAAWMKGLAEAASELRRHLLDRLRDGDLARGEELLAAMDEVYSALVVVDFPDALTGGLRRTLDALRAVLERSRGDVTATVVQTRLQRAIERQAAPGPS